MSDSASLDTLLFPKDSESVAELQEVKSWVS
jgi:hypothetical protein